MKWVRVERAGGPVFGVWQDDSIGLTVLTWADVLSGRAPEVVETVAAEEVRLLAPVARPGKIVAIGQNYWDHCRE